MACAHGVPDISKSQRADYSDGLKSLLLLINKYIEKGSGKVGKKATDKWLKEWPELVTAKFIALLVATGTRMLLTGDDRARFVVQSFAESIGILEKQTKGYSTVQEELQTTTDPQTGVETANQSSLERFYRSRVPCKCLNKGKKDKKKQVKEKYGVCSFEGCGERKPLVRLSACGGCQAVTYCCVDCQRNDWPTHSKQCAVLAVKKKEKELTITDDESSSGEYEDDDDYDDDDESGSYEDEDEASGSYEDEDEEGSYEDEESSSYEDEDEDASGSQYEDEEPEYASGSEEEEDYSGSEEEDYGSDAEFTDSEAEEEATPVVVAVEDSPKKDKKKKDKGDKKKDKSEKKKDKEKSSKKEDKKSKKKEKEGKKDKTEKKKDKENSSKKEKKEDKKDKKKSKKEEVVEPEYKSPKSDKKKKKKEKEATENIVVRL